MVPALAPAPRALVPEVMTPVVRQAARRRVPRLPFPAPRVRRPRYEPSPRWRTGALVDVYG